MRLPRDPTTHPNLPRYSGWMIEALSPSGRLTGLVFSLRVGTWVTPQGGQLFPSAEVATLYQHEYGLENCSVITDHLFDSELN